MQELEAQVKEAGITVMNEIGLDPGIDHLYAVKTIDEVHKEGGKITSFLSYCGGLPAPEASDNPLGYKFSWSSRGVLLALRNAAKFYKDGKIQEISGPELMGSAKPYLIYPGFAFVAYPNRDSTPYRERYNIPEAKTIIRGTLRYKGFPEFVKVLVDIGFLSEDKHDFLTKPITWAEAMQKILGASSRSPIALAQAISSKTRFSDIGEKHVSSRAWNSSACSPLLPLILAVQLWTLFVRGSNNNCNIGLMSGTWSFFSTNFRSRTKMAGVRLELRLSSSMVTLMDTPPWRNWLVCLAESLA